MGEKRGFSIDHFAKPIGQVQTGQGTVFVHQADQPTRREFQSLAQEAGAVRGAKIMRKIVSQRERDSFKEPVEPLPQAVFDAFSDDELGAIADLFYERIDRQRVVPESPRPTIAHRKEGEAPLEFFDRVLAEDIAAEHAELWRTIDNARDAVNPLRQALKHIGTSGDSLQNTLRELRHLDDPIKREVPTTIELGRNYVVEQQVQLSRERAQDRERMRLTSETTAKSVEMLGELVKAASIFMERMDARDITTDRQVRRQLTAALVSIIVGAVLAGAALLVSLLAYKQDSAKNTLDEATAAQMTERESARNALVEQQLVALRELRAQNAHLVAQLARIGVGQPPQAASAPSRSPATRQ